MFFCLTTPICWLTLGILRAAVWKERVIKIIEGFTHLERFGLCGATSHGRSVWVEAVDAKCAASRVFREGSVLSTRGHAVHHCILHLHCMLWLGVLGVGWMAFLRWHSSELSGCALHPGLLAENLMCPLLLIFDEYHSIRWLPFLVMAFGHFCGSSPALWTLTVTIHNLHLPVHLNEQFLCQHPGERLCRTVHRASMSLSTQQRTRLTISRLTPNSGVYCWGSSKCLMTLGRKRSFHGVQLERALVAVATGRLNITAATGCSEQGGLGAACCPRGPLCSAAEVGSNGKCSPGCLCTPPCMLLGFTGESRLP